VAGILVANGTWGTAWVEVPIGAVWAR